MIDFLFCTLIGMGVFALAMVCVAYGSVLLTSDRKENRLLHIVLALVLFAVAMCCYVAMGAGLYYGRSA